MMSRYSCSSLVAWLSYLLGSLGYAALDGAAMFDANLPDAVENALYTALAVLFVLNAVHYLWLWFVGCRRRRPDVECWPELLNVVASLLFLVSAFLFFLYPVNTESLTSRAHATVQSGLNFAAVLLFFLDALMYNSAFACRYLDASEAGQPVEPLMRSPEFFAEMFNTIPSLGYLVTGLFQFFSLLILAGRGDKNPDKELEGLLRQMRSLNVLFDLLYVIDAVLYGLVWRREQRGPEAEPAAADALADDDFRDMRRLLTGASAVDIRRRGTAEPTSVQ